MRRQHLLAALPLVFVLLSYCPSHAADAPPVRLTAITSMERIGLDQQPFGPPQVAIQAAQNEWESFQVVVTAEDEHIKVVRAVLSELRGPGEARIGGDQITIFREDYVHVRRSTPRADLPPGLYPDPLVPFVNPVTGQPIEPRQQSRKRWGEPLVTTGHDRFGVPFSVFRGQNQPLWVDVSVPRDAAPGDYRGTFRVTTAKGGTAEIPVTLTVWDFTLPDGPTHRNHFGGFSNVARYFGIARDSDRFRQIELRYCEALARHRINPPIPNRLLPKVNDDGSLTIVPDRHVALRQYLRRLHVTDFEIPRAPFARLPHATSRADYKEISDSERHKAQRYYREMVAYLKENGWDRRAYVYLLDEPNLRENYEQVLVLGQLVHEAVPELKCLVVEQTYPQDPTWPDMDPAVDIWCPLWSFIDRRTIAAKVAGGDEVWSYTALVQRSPRYHPGYARVKGREPPYWHIDRPLIVYRVPTWINWRYGITGLLYWSTVTTVMDPWENPAFAHPRHYNGGGYLFYPGLPCGIDGPVASMRIKNLRDAMEDYEYFALLGQLAGKEAVDRVVAQVAPNWWDYSRDGQRLLATRRTLAQRIVQAARGR